MNARMQLSDANSAHPREPGAEQYAQAAEVLSLLADRTRLALLHALASDEADVTTLARAVGVARPAVSQHLAKLRLAGLVTTRKAGRRVIYRLANGHLRRAVAEVLALADHHMTGQAHHD